MRIRGIDTLLILAIYFLSRSADLPSYQYILDALAGVVALMVLIRNVRKEK